MLFVLGFLAGAFRSLRPGEGWRGAIGRTCRVFNYAFLTLIVIVVGGHLVSAAR